MKTPPNLPLYISAEELSVPGGWRVLRICDIYEKLSPGRRYDSTTVQVAGVTPVINQSLDGLLGFHDDEPGVVATVDRPVVTFANHTCAMRVMRTPFSSIQNVFPMVGKAGVCETLYLYYATNGRQGIEDYKGHHPVWRNSFIPLPDLRSQRLIVEVLGRLDDLIANNRRRVELLEEMARAIYREWFVKFRYPGHEDVPLIDSALGLIPEGWVCGTLDDLVSIMKQTVDPATLEPAIPAVGLEHIPRQQVTLDDWGVTGDQGSRKSVFAKGDVLFGKIRPYFHKVSVAPFAGVCSTDAIVVRPNAAHWGQAVSVVSSSDFVAHATQTSNGTKMPRADWKVIGQWPVAVPPTSFAESFTGLFRDNLGLAETLMFENRKLSTLRDLLLPKLVTGQIDVSTLDIDLLVDEALVS